MATQAAASREIGNWKHWRLNRDLDGIAWLLLDREGEKVNSLSSEVLGELGSIVDQLETEPPAGLVLMSGKPGSFIVGADVREFDQTRDVELLKENVAKVHALFERVEKLEFPKVCAFEGFCLGGGLELALCFDWRIAMDSDKTRVGFPEVNLGIYPGYGGSGRSIQVMGGLKAMETMLTGRMLRARQARALGLVDQTVDLHGSLIWAARRAVQKKRRHKLGGVVNKLSTFGPARKLLAGQMRKQTRARARPEHYPAPYRLIDAFEAHGDSKRAMIRAEADNIPELLVGETSTNLRRVFRLMENLKGQGKKSDFTARRVHVIGAGVMGGDIAAWCALKGLEVTLQDREMKYIEPALKRARALFRKKLKTPPAVAAAQTRLRADVDGEGVKRADVVIEAIFENREAKRELFAGLAGRLQPHAVVATNTSAIPLAELADVLDEPSRLIGLHFFNPVAKMPLVEVVHDKTTDGARVDDGSSFATQIGKYALPATSTPGFLVNRVLVPYMYKAMTMHRDGIPKEALDKAAVQFGMPMGPVELVDTVGLDVGLGVIDTLLGDAAGEDRKVLESMVEAGKKGKKTGEGFYNWEKGKPVRDKDAHQGHDLEQIAADLIQPYLDECLACLRDDVVDDADLLDAGMIFGTGFAPFRGGPVHYIEHGDVKASAANSLLDAARKGTLKPAKKKTRPAKPAPAGSSAAASKTEKTDSGASAADPSGPSSPDKRARGDAPPASRKTAGKKTGRKKSTGKKTSKKTGKKTARKSAKKSAVGKTAAAPPASSTPAKGSGQKNSQAPDRGDDGPGKTD